MNIRKLIPLPILSLLLAVSINLYSQQSPKYAVIGYYMDKTHEIDSYQVEKLTHLIYSFLHLDGNVLEVHPHDSLSISHLVSLKQRNPNLKIILSLGGWGGCPSCPDVFSTEKGRKEFSQSVKNTLEKYGADGLDLDWEYPAIESVPGFKYYPEDKHNFTLLLKDLREAIGYNHELSFAAGGFKQFLDESIEWKEAIPYLDYVNLMTYDLVNGYSTKTGHHTPLHSTSGQQGSAEYVINYLDSLGVPLNKMILGAAFYARVFKDVPDVNNGLYQPGKFADYVNYKNFNSYFGTDSGYVVFWDPIAGASYAYNREKQRFASFDNKESIRLKSDYVKSKGLGGIMFWSLSGDTYQDGLLDVIDKSIRSK